MKFSIKDFLSKCDKIRKFPADLVTFTEEIFNGKLRFLFSAEIYVTFVYSTMEPELSLE